MTLGAKNQIIDCFKDIIIVFINIYNGLINLDTNLLKR